jgi:muramoyltetrapeptide carboxypeptidase
MPDGFLVPPALVAGSRITIVAPSSAFPEEEFEAGVAWLRQRYDVLLPPGLRRRHGYLAGTDAERLGELTHALERDDVAAVFAARGGYGATRILDAVPWHHLRRAPKWLVGFSDITALHLRAQLNGVCSIHGPNVTTLPRAPRATRERLLAACEGTPLSLPLGEALRTFVGPETVVRGRAVGGNLSLVQALAASAGLPEIEDAVWFIEDVTERPYRIDRMLTSLLPTFRRARAVIFGSFSQCEPGPDGVSVADVLRDFSARLACPVWVDAPFGHAPENHSLRLGAEVLVCSTRVDWP